MKNVYSVGILLLLSLYLHAQNNVTPNAPHDDTKVDTFSEQNPEFPGGEAALMRFLQQNIHYPALERDNNIQGKVLIRFVVMETGDVADVQVIKGVSPGLDKEAMRVVKMLPKFKPGTQKGKPVRVYFNLPVKFGLQGDADLMLMANLKNKFPDNKFIKAGTTRYSARNYDWAAESFSNAANKIPDGMIYAALAECYKKLGERENVCEALHKAVTLGYTVVQDDWKSMCK